MATITLSMNSTPFTGTKTFTGTDTDMQNLLNWGAVRYASVLPASPTNAQIGTAIANGIIQDLKNNVQQFETTLNVPAAMSWA